MRRWRKDEIRWRFLLSLLLPPRSIESRRVRLRHCEAIPINISGRIKLAQLKFSTITHRILINNMLRIEERQRAENANRRHCFSAHVPASGSGENHFSRQKTHAEAWKRQLRIPYRSSFCNTNTFFTLSSFPVVLHPFSFVSLPVFPSFAHLPSADSPAGPLCIHCKIWSGLTWARRRPAVAADDGTACYKRSLGFLQDALFVYMSFSLK